MSVPAVAGGSALAYLECSATGERLPPGRLWNLSPAGAPLLVRYDLSRARRTLSREAVLRRVTSMWRYHEVLPAPSPSAVVSLGEGMTPLLEMPRLARWLGLRELHVKDEGQNPGGSFKSRGLSVAVGMARHLGARSVAMPTAGNAGGAAAAYAARAGLAAQVFVPADAPRANHVEAAMCGASVTVVEGTLLDCGRRVAELAPREGWFDLSTFREPYRVEGKKTLAYELAEQAPGGLPDVILWPTGGGTGLVALWKGFDELQRLGWIDARRPRLVAVQAEGCAPLVRAFAAGAVTADVWERPSTRVSGLRAPRLLADRLCLAALRKSDGSAIAVPDAAMFEAVRETGAREGLHLCPETGACVAALPVLLERGVIGRDERVVLFNTAAGVKYID